MLDLVQNPPPGTLEEVWRRTIRLGTSIQDVKIFKAFALVAGANLLRHDCKERPRAATVQLVDTAAPTATVAVDPAITATFLTIHASADATVDVVVWL